MDKRVYGDDVRVLPDITSEGKENEHGMQRKNEPGSKKVNFISLKETAQASRKIEIMVGSLPIRSRGRRKSSSDSCSSAAEEATSRSRSSSNSSTQWRIGDERKKRIGDEIHSEDSTEKSNQLHDTVDSSHSEFADFSKHQHEEAASDESAAERQLLAVEAHQDENNDSEDSFSEESDLTNLEICGGSLMSSTLTSLNHSCTHPLQPPSPISSQDMEAPVPPPRRRSRTPPSDQIDLQRRKQKSKKSILDQEKGNNARCTLEMEANNKSRSLAKEWSRGSENNAIALEEFEKEATWQKVEKGKSLTTKGKTSVDTAKGNNEELCPQNWYESPGTSRASTSAPVDYSNCVDRKFEFLMPMLAGARRQSDWTEKSISGASYESNGSGTDIPDACKQIRRRALNPSTLHEAAALGSLEMMAMLLDSGNFGIDSRTAKGNTALHICIYEGHAEAADYLIRRGANIAIQNCHEQRAFDFLSSSTLEPFSIEELPWLMNAAAAVAVHKAERILGVHTQDSNKVRRQRFRDLAHLAKTNPDLTKNLKDPQDSITEGLAHKKFLNLICAAYDVLLHRKDIKYTACRLSFHRSDEWTEIFLVLESKGFADIIDWFLTHGLDGQRFLDLTAEEMQALGLGKDRAISVWKRLHSEQLSCNLEEWLEENGELQLFPQLCESGIMTVVQLMTADLKTCIHQVGPRRRLENLLTQQRIAFMAECEEQFRKMKEESADNFTAPHDRYIPARIKFDDEKKREIQKDIMMRKDFDAELRDAIIDIADELAESISCENHLKIETGTCIQKLKIRQRELMIRATEAEDRVSFIVNEHAATLAEFEQQAHDHATKMANKDAELISVKAQLSNFQAFDSARGPQYGDTSPEDDEIEHINLKKHAYHTMRIINKELQLQAVDLQTKLAQVKREKDLDNSAMAVLHRRISLLSKELSQQKKELEQERNESRALRDQMESLLNSVTRLVANEETVDAMCQEVYQVKLTNSNLRACSCKRREKVAYGEPNMKKAQSSLFAAVLACALFSSDAFSPSSIITPLRAGLTAPSIRAAGERANPTLRDRVPSRARATTTPLHLKALFGLGGSGKKKVGVIGATGGVGRLAVAYLLEQGCEVRAIVRDKDRAAALLPSNIELKIGDMADPTYGEGLATAISGVDALICATGTTAFPTDKWGENRKNNPKAVDEDGIKNVVAAISEVNKKNGRKMKKIALLSSIGVERRDQFPFTLLNFYGVLDAKFAGEQAVKGGAKSAGYSYALARLGRLVGGPYTGTPDVASLLQLEEGSNQAITMRKGDPKAFAGDLSRKQGAMALVQSVLTDKQDFEFAIVNKPGPQPTQQEWDTAFMNLDLDMAEEIRDFSFLVTDLVAKASKVFEDAQLSNNIVGFDSAKLQKASSKIVSFGKEMLTKVQAWSESDKSKVSTLETDKDKLS